jgi:type II secretory pathway predicted ATPase ExeA
MSLYTEFYGLIERPFELTPDQRYLYLSAHHREALAHLTYGVEERKGFVQLTGEVGTGKTTMLDALVVGLDASTKVARLAHTTIDEIDLLRVLARGFGVELQGVTKSDMLAEIGETLGGWAKEARNAVFIVDEAQNLSLGVLEEIRLLSNLRANGRSSLQIVLAGQPEFRAKLERRELRQLRQRIGIRYHLTPLSRDETGEYIEHRLTVAGATQAIFDRGSVQAVYEYSRGVPRVINTICDRALLAGYAEGRGTVTKELVLSTIEAIEGRVPDEPPTLIAALERQPRAPRHRRRGRLFPTMAITAAAVVTVMLVWLMLGWRQPESKSARPGAQGAGVVEPSSPGGNGDVPADRGVVSPAGLGGDRATDSVPESERPGDGGPVAGSAPDHAFPSNGPDGGRTIESSEPARTEPMVGEGRVPTEPADALVRGPGGPYVVVAASSKSEVDAEALVARLERQGLAAGVERAVLPESGVWFRVVLEGGYPTIGMARVVAESLREAGHEDPWVLRR